jgi:hypothetical protein
VTAARARVGAGREAEIPAWGEGRVLRLLWSSEREPALDHEDDPLGDAGGRRVGQPVAWGQHVTDEEYLAKPSPEA